MSHLFFDVDRISIEMIRIDNEYFPCNHLTVSEDDEERVVASIPLENGAELVVLVRADSARCYVWDHQWCKIERGRIVPAGLNPRDDWNEAVRSTDDIKAYMRQFGAMEASRYTQIGDQASSAPGQLGDQDDDSTLAELLA